MKLKATEPNGETTVVDTDNARQSWQCKGYDAYRAWLSWSNDGPREEWARETLYLSAKGRYYIVTDTAWRGNTPSETPSARFVDEREAAQWLRLNEHDLPEDLKAFDPTE